MRDLALPTFPVGDLVGPATSRRSLHRRDRPAAGHAVDAHRFDVVWARDEDEVLQAQQLRHLVFDEEMGARLRVPHRSPAGHDIDLFDPFCEHLLVRARPGRRGRPGDRHLPRADARQRAPRRRSVQRQRVRSTRSRPLRPRMVELGRSCVHPDWRSGGAILALWGALAEFIRRDQLDTMIGCASVSMRDGGRFAASLWTQLRRTHVAPIHWQVTPRLALPVDELQCDLRVEAPALIKGYLRCGAKVLGAPAWDQHRRSADAAAHPRPAGALPPALSGRVTLGAYWPSPNLSLISAVSATIAACSSGPVTSISTTLPIPAASIITPMMLLALTRRSLRVMKTSL